MEISKVYSALNNLVSLDTIGTGGALLSITSNAELISLDGLGNIDPATISNLVITDNSLLSTCEVEAICNYLGIPVNTANIQSNDTGCNTRSEVETACNALAITKNDFGASLYSYPNPARDQITIELGEIYSEIIITTRNLLGQTIDRQAFRQVDQVSLDFQVPNGMYLVEVVAKGGKTAVIKVVKE
ncbi:MAG: T9SS type A sorting domain-containing protein [Bacteroidia bacterium]